MPKLELKEMFLWEQSSHHSPKQNDIVLAHVRRLKLCSGKGSWASAATHAMTQSIMQDVSAYTSVEPFLLHGRVCLDIKRRAFLRFRNVTRALVRPEERVKADPRAVLYNCLKKMAESNSVSWWPQALQQVAVVMGCHMGGWTWGIMISLGGWCCRRTRYLSRWTDFCLMFMVWLNETTWDLQ